MTESAGESVIDVLDSDHRAIAELLEEAAAAGPDDVEPRCERVVMEIVRHFIAEEQYVYPTIREHAANGARLADDGLAEHREIEGMLRQLEHVDRSPTQVTPILAELATAFAAHVNRQHESVAPALVAVRTPQQLIELGDDMIGAEALAPTRPRTVIANPLLNKIASFAEGWIDKVRDEYSHRGVEEDR